jgi:hypothetical protein
MPRGYQGRDRVDVVTLDRVVCNAVSPDEAALDAPVDHRQALAAAMVDPLRLHQSAAVRRAIAGLDVEMPRPQARGAVVAITAVGQRQYRDAAPCTAEALILGSPADGSASGLKR